MWRVERHFPWTKKEKKIEDYGGFTPESMSSAKKWGRCECACACERERKNYEMNVRIRIK